MTRFVAAGEALTDLLTTGPGTWTSQTGGSTWNVARVVARLGIASAFAGAVSRDVFGAELAAASAAAGLDVAAGTAACRVAGAQPPALDAVLALAEITAVQRDETRL